MKVEVKVEMSHPERRSSIRQGRMHVWLNEKKKKNFKQIR